MSEVEHYEEEVPSTVHSLEIPVAEFEGELIRVMHGRLPGITLDMEYGYRRDTHLKLEMEVRIKKVSIDEGRGRLKGDLVRVHEFDIVEARVVGAYTADELDPGVGGSASVSAQHELEKSEHEESDESPEGEDDERADPFDPGF